MKFIMLAGAFAGFAIGIGVGWYRHCAPADIFWHACVAMYAGGMLARWYGRLWLGNFREACEQRALQIAATAEAAQATENRNRPANPVLS